MDELKITIKTYFELLIMVASLILVIGVFFYTETKAGMGIFGKTGIAFTQLITDESAKTKGTGHLQEMGSVAMPSIVYSKGVLQKGDCVEFKSLFSVTSEKEFEIYLLDIQTKDGNSVFENMYDKDEDMLYIRESGIYIVNVRIYSETGGTDTYSFQLPVE